MMNVRNGANTINQIVIVGRKRTALKKQREMKTSKYRVGSQELQDSASREAGKRPFSFCNS